MKNDSLPDRRKVLVADDDDIVRATLEEALAETEFAVVSARDGKEALSRLTEEVVVAVLDLNMPELGGLECLQFIRKNHPDIEAVICTASSEIGDAVEAMKSGAFDYVTKPVNVDELIELVHRAAETARLRQENRQLRQAISVPAVKTNFIGDSPQAQQLLKMARKIAALKSTVMITGESGVGKGLLARIIHNLSPRRSQPFVTVSCTSLPRDLVEAELFGHEKGAFTGAHDKRPGRVEMADGGTLFLDEVGDMPIDLQPKLLTFLQDRAFQRIGGNRVISVDLHVIAATHQDLREMCREKKFREDLYFRLNVLPMHIPPLRERRQDIPLLADFLLGQIAKRRRASAHKVSKEAMQLLTAYSWPGNVRELENVLERTTAFSDGLVIEPDELPLELREKPMDAPLSAASLAGMTLVEIEKAAIAQTLEMCGGNKSQTARRLGISEKSVYNKMKRLGLS